MSDSDNVQHRLFDDDPDPWELDDAEEVETAAVVFAEQPFGPYDYLVPARLGGKLFVGARVRVPLGRGNRSMLGYCIGLQTRAGDKRKFKEITDLIDESPLLAPPLLRLAEWMADYYVCRLGQVFEAIVPAGVRGRAGTREVTLLSVPTQVAARIATLKLPPKQMEALRLLASSPRPLTPPELAKAARCTLQPIADLRKKKLITAETTRQQTAQSPLAPEQGHAAHHLEDDQQRALDDVLNAVRSGRHETILLHGVTGSGKTELYIRAIEETISYGRQAIVLVPEISLTPQTRQRFRSRFERVALLHSHLTDAERHWHWRQIADGEIDVVVGARSAVFAPTPRLGLIVIDEEHDPSFKQNESPRYHARDAALFRTRAENVPLVLGSATPSLESLQASRDGRFRLVEMPKRVNRLPLPDVQIVDLRSEIRNRTYSGAISRQLHNAMEQTLRQDGQVMLLLNRRGFATHVQCPACGYTAKCPNCDISLTHHREGERLLCHYCEYETAAPPICPDCKFQGIRYAGIGTERLENEIQARFKGVPLLRMDGDTMRQPGSHERALARFRAGEAKILLGTQMIAKGLDFPNVMLVGVVNADTSLHFPDFRAAERTFQLVTQVAGRTGRGERGGRVLVQTFSPEHPAIQAAAKHDYAQFAAVELPIREEFGYPPTKSLLRLVVRGEVESQAAAYAETLTETLRKGIQAADPDVRILGPAPCPMPKLRNLFRFHTLIMTGRTEEIRPALHRAVLNAPEAEGVQSILDVDPQDLL